MSISVPEAQDDVLKRLVLSTKQRYSDGCRKGAKTAEHIHTYEAGIRSFLLYPLKKIEMQSPYSLQTSNCPATSLF